MVSLLRLGGQPDSGDHQASSVDAALQHACHWFVTAAGPAEWRHRGYGRRMNGLFLTNSHNV
jgi:hypothetical protein